MKSILMVFAALGVFSNLILYGVDLHFYRSVSITMVEPGQDPFEIKVKSEHGINVHDKQVSHYYIMASVYEKGFPYEYKMDDIKEKKFKILSECEFLQVVGVLHSLDLWKYHKSYPAKYSLMDGTRFRIEFSSSGSMFGVNFSSPQGQEWWPEMAKLVNLMKELSGISTGEEE